MRTTLLLSTIATLLLFTNCKKSEDPCKTSVPAWCHLADLSDTYDPFCGCDGKTYQNKAHAECAGLVSFKKGHCW